MKKVAYIIALIFCSSGCNNSSDELIQDNPTSKIPEDISGVEFGNITLPKGTKSQVSKDGSTLEVILPENLNYIGFQNGELVTLSSGCWSCSSSCTGCDVVKLGNDVGCSRCETGFISECVGSSCDGLSGFSLEGGGLIDLNAKISVVTKPEDLNMSIDQAPSWKALINHPTISNEIDQFLRDAWEGEIDHSKANLVPVNIYGSLVRLYLPGNKYLNTRSLGVTCNCTSGSSGCNYEKITKGFVHLGDKCAANGCTTCQMSY